MHIFCQGDKFLTPIQKIILFNPELTLLFENERVVQKRNRFNNFFRLFLFSRSKNGQIQVSKYFINMLITQYFVLNTYLPINRITKAPSDKNKAFTASFLEKTQYNIMIKYG